MLNHWSYRLKKFPSVIDGVLTRFNDYDWKVKGPIMVNDERILFGILELERSYGGLFSTILFQLMRLLFPKMNLCLFQLWKLEKCPVS